MKGSREQVLVPIQGLRLGFRGFRRNVEPGFGFRLRSWSHQSESRDGETTILSYTSKNQSGGGRRCGGEGGRGGVIERRKASTPAIDS